MMKSEFYLLAYLFSCMQVLLFRGELIPRHVNDEYEIILRYKGKDILCMKYSNFSIIDVCILDVQAIEMHIKECIYASSDTQFSECRTFRVAIFIYEKGHLFDDDYLIAAILVD